MQMNNNDFKGQYRYNVHIPRMFDINFQSDWIPNLVTNGGRTFLLNRMAVNTTGPVSHMAVGTGTTAPALDQTTLTTETVRKAVTYAVTATSPNWYTTFTSTFTATELNNTTEIALLTASSGGTMVTRSTHTAISLPAGSSMSIDYQLILQTSNTLTGFTQYSGANYSVDQTIAVAAVIEADTGNGYVKKTSITDVTNTANTYFYDSANHKLYIHCSDGANPSTHTIQLVNGG